MAQYQAPFIIDPDLILDELEQREQLEEQAWAMALEKAYAAAADKFDAEGFKNRIERAIYLVENEMVYFDASGRMWVKSESRPDINYVVRKALCKCEDAQKEAAPNGFCKHRIASWIYAQAHVLKDEIMSDENGHDDQTDFWNRPEAAAMPSPQMEPGREVRHVVNNAPCKATIKWRDEMGMEIWVIIEDDSDRSLLERTQKYREYAYPQIDRANKNGIQQFGVPQGKGSSGRKPSGPKLRCPHHGVNFGRGSKDGKYLHKTDDGKWCFADEALVKEFEAQHNIPPFKPQETA